MTASPVEIVRGGRLLPQALATPNPVFAVVIGSTRTSTIPGISIAGPTPEATLLTPTLDVEYLLEGKGLTLDVVPVSPQGVPTPALITRASLTLAWDAQPLVIDAGAHTPPKTPHTRLPSRTVGGRIDEEPGLDPDRGRALYAEARSLGRRIGRGRVLVVGESIPGGTTTALAIIAALGYVEDGLEGKVSSSAPENPAGLKARVVQAALRRLGEASPGDPVGAASLVGDPVHVAIAGLAHGALEAPARAVILAGGTQMIAPLAILARLGVLRGEAARRIANVTTRWIHDDPSSDWAGLLARVAPDVEAGYVNLDLSRSAFPGLRMYEEGYAKEGVGAGGAAALAAVRAGLEAVALQVDYEYWRLTRRDEGQE